MKVIIIAQKHQTNFFEFQPFCYGARLFRPTWHIFQIADGATATVYKAYPCLYFYHIVKNIPEESTDTFGMFLCLYL